MSHYPETDEAAQLMFVSSVDLPPCIRLTPPLGPRSRTSACARRCLCQMRSCTTRFVARSRTSTSSKSSRASSSSTSAHPHYLVSYCDFDAHIGTCSRRTSTSRPRSRCRSVLHRTSCRRSNTRGSRTACSSSSVCGCEIPRNFNTEGLWPCRWGVPWVPHPVQGRCPWRYPYRHVQEQGVSQASCLGGTLCD